MQNTTTIALDIQMRWFVLAVTAIASPSAI
jgi:hypothetical protein